MCLTGLRDWSATGYQDDSAWLKCAAQGPSRIKAGYLIEVASQSAVPDKMVASQAVHGTWHSRLALKHMWVRFIRNCSLLSNTLPPQVKNDQPYPPFWPELDPVSCMDVSAALSCALLVAYARR